MAFEPIPVREARQGVAYDGTNSAEINAAISDLQIVSEDANGLTFTSGGQQYTVARDGWLSWYQGEVTDVFQNKADFDAVYASASLLDNHVHDLVLTTGPAKSGDNER